MRLGCAEFQKLTFGAEQVEMTSEGVRFHRFSKEEEAWLDLNESFAIRSRSGAGIRLDFETDAKR